MRVISGTARSLILKTIPGDETRPTTDKIKETLFNMINFDLPGCSFLDLYAGSGAIGIEALSRGAKRAVFVDNNPKAVSVIRENVEHTKFADGSTVISSDVLSALKRMDSTEKEVFDIVFLDPPYDRGLEDGALKFLKTSHLIGEHTKLIVEMNIRADVSKYTEMGYETVKEKLYKTNKHIFLRRIS